MRRRQGRCPGRRRRYGAGSDQMTGPQRDRIACFDPAERPRNVYLPPQARRIAPGHRELLPRRKDSHQAIGWARATVDRQAVDRNAHLAGCQSRCEGRRTWQRRRERRNDGSRRRRQGGVGGRYRRSHCARQQNRRGRRQGNANACAIAQHQHIVPAYPANAPVIEHLPPRRRVELPPSDQQFLANRHRINHRVDQAGAAAHIERTDRHLHPATAILRGRCGGRRSRACPGDSSGRRDNFAHDQRQRGRDAAHVPSPGHDGQRLLTKGIGPPAQQDLEHRLARLQGG